MQLMVPAETAHDTITALGDIGLLQFKDLNTDKSAFQRCYASQVVYLVQAESAPPVIPPPSPTRTRKNAHFR